jgi:hypothetical protein
MSPSVFLRLLFLSVFSVALFGCAHEVPVVLPPQKCHPADDLPPNKSISIVPERELENDEVFAAWLGDRGLWAKDVQDYNSLYRQCVGD